LPDSPRSSRRRRRREAVVVGLVAAKELRETLRDRRTLRRHGASSARRLPARLAAHGAGHVGHTARGQARRSRVAVVGPAAASQAVRARLSSDAREFDAGALAGLGRDDAAGTARPSSRARSMPSPRSRRGRAARRAFGSSTTRRATSRARRTIAWRRAGRRLAPGCAPLFSLEDQSVAPRARVGGYVLSKLLPLIVVVMIMLGAFYPAIDITAGERERGTLETILSAP